MKDSKAGFMFIELLLVAAIIMFILLKIFDFYFKKPTMNKDTRDFITSQGIGVTVSPSVVGSTKSKLENIQKQHLDQFDSIK